MERSRALVYTFYIAGAVSLACLFYELLLVRDDIGDYMTGFKDGLAKGRGTRGVAPEGADRTGTHQERVSPDAPRRRESASQEEDAPASVTRWRGRRGAENIEGAGEQDAGLRSGRVVPEQP